MANQFTSFVQYYNGRSETLAHCAWLFRMALKPVTLNGQCAVKCIVNGNSCKFTVLKYAQLTF